MEDAVKEEQGCKNQAIQLQCPSNDVLIIVRAECGEIQDRKCTCKGGPGKCDSHNCSNTVRDICHQQTSPPSSCTLHAGSEELGHKCAGKKKYLFVEYECDPVETTSAAKLTTKAAEDSTSILTTRSVATTKSSIVTESRTNTVLSSSTATSSARHETQSQDATGWAVPVTTDRGEGTDPVSSNPSFIIGIVVGGIFLLLLLAAVFLFFKRKRTANSTPAKQAIAEEKPNALYEMDGNVYTTAEDCHQVTAEQKQNALYHMDEDYETAKGIDSQKQRIKLHEMENVYTAADDNNGISDVYAVADDFNLKQVDTYTEAEDSQVTTYESTDDVNNQVIGRTQQSAQNVYSLADSEEVSERIMTENILYGSH